MKGKFSRFPRESDSFPESNVVFLTWRGDLRTLKHKGGKALSLPPDEVSVGSSLRT